MARIVPVWEARAARGPSAGKSGVLTELSDDNMEMSCRQPSRPS